MHPNTRACVAYIAGKLITGSGSSSVYDYSQSRHINISGTVDVSHVGVYDHNRGCHFSGNLPNLYDYGRGAHVSLNINGTQFGGYDFGEPRDLPVEGLDKIDLVINLKTANQISLYHSRCCTGRIR
jgi:hypothetical protein